MFVSHSRLCLMDAGDRQWESHILRAGCEGKTYELLIIFSDFYSPLDSLQSPRIVLLVVLFFAGIGRGICVASLFKIGFSSLACIYVNTLTPSSELR